MQMGAVWCCTWVVPVSASNQGEGILVQKHRDWNGRCITRLLLKVVGHTPNTAGTLKGSSISWVAKFNRDKNSECKLSNGWLRSYRKIKLLLPAGKRVVTKFLGHTPNTAGTFRRIFWNNSGKTRERKVRTKFFCTNFLNTARGPGHPGKNPGTSQIPLFETQGRQTFEGGHEVFGHHPSAWKTPTPPGGLRTQKVNLCALFSCLKDPRKRSESVSWIPLWSAAATPQAL